VGQSSAGLAVIVQKLALVQAGEGEREGESSDLSVVAFLCAVCIVPENCFYFLFAVC
jgi:hypothetical protein